MNYENSVNSMNAPAPMPDGLRRHIDDVHEDAVALVEAAVRADRVAVLAIVARSTDPQLLAGVTAHLASWFAWRTGHPFADCAQLRQLLTDDLERLRAAGAGR